MAARQVAGYRLRRLPPRNYRIADAIAAVFLGGAAGLYLGTRLVALVWP